MRVIIVGAGILGCALAYRLSRDAQADVTVIDAAQGPATGATGASFGWINASFFADDAHFRLRAAGLESWRGLQSDLGLDTVTWPGALWWEAQGGALDAMQDTLTALGYNAQKLGQAEIAAREPALLCPPADALHFTTEGSAEPAHTCAALLRGAQKYGARVLYGVRVLGVDSGCVMTQQGALHADQVVIAAGTGAEALLKGAGAYLPMLSRPGVILRTAPMAPLLRHILVTPDGEVRQDAQGRIVMPATIAHQSDSADQVHEALPDLADRAALRLRALLRSDTQIDWAEAALAWRPVPQDGLPFVGAVTDGLYAAVMHSGVTLAAIVADLACAELTGQNSNRTQMLAPYRPGRFERTA